MHCCRLPSRERTAKGLAGKAQGWLYRVEVQTNSDTKAGIAFEVRDALQFIHFTGRADVKNVSECIERFRMGSGSTQSGERE